MYNSITELAVLLALTALAGVIARLFRQPMILAYIVVGAAVSALHLVPLSESPLYESFSEMGVMLLLFLIGLEINVNSLKRVGGSAVILGLGQIIITFVGGFFIGLLLGLEPVTAAYIAIAVTFSSTVIVVKLLSEKQDMNSLYGKLSLGILLVQDIVAIILLIVLAGLQPGGSLSAAAIILVVSEALLLFGFAYWLGRVMLPLIFQRIAHSEELLFITSLAWVFLLSAAVQKLGFSVEIGGFLAGLSLANSSTHYQIASRVKPLRDFFIAVFFIVLGSTIAIANFSNLSLPIIVFSLFVIIGNPLIILVIMGVMGYHRRTSFMTGVAVAQISEFSLVLAAIGLRLGHITSEAVTVITAVGVVTIALSSYLILYGDEIYRAIEPLVKFFHRGNAPLEPISRSPFDRPILIIGAHRIGRSIARRLPKRNVVILDSDPDVVASLKAEGYRTIFGDSSDVELLREIPFQRITLVISTSPNLEDNLRLLEYLRTHPLRHGRKRRVIIRAENDLAAQELYARHVDYVLQPQISSGQHLGRLLSRSRHFTVLDELREHDQRLQRHTDHE